VSRAAGPIYTLRGAGPRPLVPQKGDVSTSRPTVALGVVMVGWLFFMMALAALGGASGPGTAAPVTLDRGVIVTPAEGWTSAADIWNVGPGAVSLKRAGAVVVFAANSYDGTAGALLEDEVRQLRSQFSSFRSLPTGTLTVAGGIPAVNVLFSGTAESGQLEGELVAASWGGTGVVMVAVAPFGQLRQVQGDIDEMLAKLEIP